MLKGLLASAGNVVGGGEPTDEYFNQVALLLKQQSVDAVDNQTYVDSSSTGHTITPSGTPCQGSFSPFQPNGWSGYLNGTAGLSFADTANLQPSSSDFTISLWFRIDDTSVDNVLVDFGSQGAAASFLPFYYLSSSGKLVYYLSSGGGTWNIASGVQFSASTIVKGQWYHAALVRDGSTITPYLDGVAGTTTSSASAIHNSGTARFIGCATTSAVGLKGDLFDVNFIKGTATITGAFTPPTAISNIHANTELACFRTNRFQDVSVNDYAPTVIGTPKVVAGNSLLSRVAYDPDTHGGSAYFDGTGDYISATVTSGLDFVTGTPFTLDLFYYHTAAGATDALMGKGGGTLNWTSPSGIQYHLTLYAGNLYWEFRDGGALARSIIVTEPKPFQWTHIAVGYDGTTTRMWVNGVSVGTSSYGYVPPTTKHLFHFGKFPGASSHDLLGFVGPTRIVNGTDIYGTGNTTITVPTELFTDVTNTELLTHFNNAGIYDATCKSNLITRNNTETDTAVVKFDAASALFAAGDGIEVLHPTLAEALRRGNWTIEAWVYPTTYTSSETVFSRGDVSSTSTDFLSLQRTGTNKMGFFWRSGSPLLTSSATISTSAWVHVMVTKDGSDFEMFINGTSDVTNTNASELAAGSAPRLWCGTQSYDPTASGRVWLGNLENIRISIGIVRETASFTAPTETYPVQGAN